MKLSNPEAYISFLKSVVRHVFPKSGVLRYEPEPGKRIENYEHLLKDRRRSEYVHSLPRTLKNHDVSVKFITPAGEAKAYLIKKYFDAEIQKDIWDLLVIREATVKTKFVNKENPGNSPRYIENQIIKTEE